MKFIVSIFFKGFYYSLTSKSFRCFVWFACRFSYAPRYKQYIVKIFENNFKIADGKSFVWQYYEIFFKQFYHFPTTRNNPVVIDCGSNIGLSIMHYVRQYPNAKIEAFEPDNMIYEILLENVNTFGAKNNIQLHKKAVWTQNTMLSFSSEGADGGSISDNTQGGNMVETIDFREVLEKYERIDFLKIDIEGAEFQVLNHCKTSLNKVNYLFVEYHGFEGQEQYLAEILTILKQNNFDVKLENPRSYMQPFIKPAKVNQLGMNLQLNIIAINKQIG